MKIRGWSIDGFGHFRDYEVPDIGDGLTVFHGPNEAGKSTILAFVRGMLFGLPDRRSREQRYEPLRGGRHGGRLFVDVDGEPWTLERDLGARGGGVRIVTPRGEGTADDLRLALGSADTRLFRSVFAFSLTELQSFESLSDEGARSRIFSAGIVGAGRAARQVIAEISERADALFKPRGRQQVIPTLLKELAEQRQATAAARRAARAYPELLRAEEECLAEKQRLEVSIDAARREARRRERLLSLWPLWRDLRDAERQLAQLEQIERFPANAEGRLADLGSRLGTTRVQRFDAVVAYESAAERVVALSDDLRDDLTAVAADVTAHCETRDLYRSTADRLRTALAESGHAAEAFARALRELGDGWDEPRLEAFDASLPQRDRIRGWVDRLRNAADAVRSAERAAAATTEALQRADRDAATAAAELQGVPAPTPDQVDALEAALRRLRGHVADRRDRELAAEHAQAVLAEREHALRMIESEAESGADPASAPGDNPAAHADPGPAVPSTDPTGAVGGPGAPAAGEVPPDKVLAAAPFAVAIFGLFIAAVVASARPWLATVVAVLAVAAGIMTAAWLTKSRERAARAAADARTAAAERLATVERAAAADRREAADRLAAAARAVQARRRAYAARCAAAKAHLDAAGVIVDRARAELERAGALVTTEAVALGLGPTPCLADIDVVDRRAAQQRQLAARAEHLRRTVAEAETRLGSARDRATADARRLHEAGARLATERQEWVVWARAIGLPGDMGAESALDFVPAIQHARERQHGRDKMRAHVSALELEVQAWEARATNLLARAGADRNASVPEAGALLDALLALSSRCSRDAETRRRRVTAEGDLQTCQNRLDAAEAEAERCEDAWAALLTEAGARDEDHYRSRMETYATSGRLARETERLQRQLTDRVGDGADADAIRGALATGAVAEWEREREYHEGEAAALDERLEEAIRAHQDAQRAREAVETSADIPKCEAVEQGLLTALGEAVDQWRTLALARALTEVTLAEYVRTRQPAVVANASAMFAAVTDGAYTGLRQDVSGEGLAVVTRRGAVLGPEHLSRGTAEQLYLCLRLGLAAEFASHGAQLPLVMDDVCVNFDPERARAIASVLVEFAAGQQVIFFTCHPATVDMLQTAAPNSCVHELPRHGPRTSDIELAAARP